MSVAIPAYNHARYIYNCLESIKQQTYSKLELIVVDDGSSDATGDIVQNFMQQHCDRFQRTVLIEQKNQGVSAASNRAIAACQGEWVHLVGSDDWLYPHKIATQWQTIQQWRDEPLALVYADVDFVDQDGAIIPKKGNGKRPAPGLDAQAYRWLVLGNHIPNPTVMLHRQRFLHVGGFDESLALEDWDCWLRLSARYTLARVPQTLAAYRRHDNNASLQHAMMLAASWRTLGQFFEQYADQVSPALIRASFHWRMRSFRRWAWKQAPVLLLKIGRDSMWTRFRTPTPALFHDYARITESIAHFREHLAAT